ncbi:MAG: hypothetical protein HYZ28_14635 [Myxococcales bacterium]|nr:hypothetical protein [Myxococcales bacterium]
MRWLTAGILASLLWGCGVGVDDPEGQAAAGLGPAVVKEQSQRSQLTGDQTKSAASAEGSQTGQKTGGSISYDPNKVLPQDPVPLLPTGKPDTEEGAPPINPRT